MMFWDDLLEFGAILALVFAAVFVMFGVVVFTEDHFDRRACTNLQEVTGKPTRYERFDGCYVEHQGEWMRFSTYEAIVVAREGLASKGGGS